VPILSAAGRHDLADDEWRVLEADALEDLSPTGSDGLLKQLTKAVLETAPGQMRCGGRCSRDGAPGLIGVACLPARGLGHPERGGSG
jgi:hypothetical protein